MLDLRLPKVFFKVIFLYSHLPEGSYSIFHSEVEISELPEESTNIFQQSMLNRYIDRPLSQKKNSESYFQPVLSGGGLIECNHSDCSFPNIIPSLSSKEKLKC